MDKSQTFYCEKYGILESSLNGKYLIYYSSYPSEIKEDRETYKIIVDLELFEEVERKKLKCYYKKGEVNRYL